MKNRATYLVLAFTPIIFSYLIGAYVDEVFGLCLLGLYLFVYRSFLDSKRLYNLGEISEVEFRKWWVPFYKSWWYPITHFRKLYLK
ncbi:MAG: hypothetical protein JJ895_08880 [Balneolaceae bacterium]|nr:hypothetical protein [Balneolaceae bacterium]